MVTSLGVCQYFRQIALAVKIEFYMYNAIERFLKSDLDNTYTLKKYNDTLKLIAISIF